MAQGVRYDNNLTVSAKDVPVGAEAPLRTVPYGMVSVYTDNTLSILAGLYSDQGLTLPVANPLTADVEGRFGFWVAPGNYVYTVLSAAGAALGSYNLTLTAGATGPSGTIAIGAVAIGGPSSAAVSNTGTPTAAVLNFTIPQGPVGATGAAGPTGPPLTPLGAWASTTTYLAGEVVTNGGQSFISLQSNNIGYAPTLPGSASWWMILAQGFQLNQFLASLTFPGTGPQTITVQHSLNTATPYIEAFVATGSRKYSITILDVNNVSVTWYGAMTGTLMFTNPSAFLNTAAAYNAAGLPTGGLVEYWPMTEGNGLVLNNSATLSNPMVVTSGVATWGAVTGFPGPALTFAIISNGAAAPATAAHVNPLSDLDPTVSGITIAGWFIQNNTFPEGRIFIGNGRTSLAIEGGTIAFGATGGYRNLNYLVPPATLIHVAVAYDGSGNLSDPHIVYYINGVAIANGYGPDGSPTSGTSSPWTMAGFYTGSEGQTMTLAGQGVWNRALTAAEVAHLYALGVPQT